ncbi:MAG: metal-dependent hydrolase [Salinisphaeraceae bacterium]|nr:metal-dependent hydrolase [Salinisphaeraceae bacterium]
MAVSSRKIGYDEVEHRDLHFELSPDTVPRHWLGNNPWLTHWLNGILAPVPEGERWVMHSARAQLDKLDDPSVRKAAIGFIRQERTHAREHDVMNDIVIGHGIPLDEAEKLFVRIRSLMEKHMSDDMQSAMGAAFEHFTAIISSIMLRHPEIFDDTPPELAAMLYWHFVEETEHKSVSFDVFVDSVGGGARGYVMRISAMALATAIFVPMLHGNWLYFLWKDKQLLRPVKAAQAAWTLLVKPGLARKPFISEYLPFYKPSFHPWDEDNRDYIHAWKRAYNESGDTLEAYYAYREWHARKHDRANTAPWPVDLVREDEPRSAA